MSTPKGLVVLLVVAGVASAARADEDVKLDPVVVKGLGQPAADSPTETRVIDPVAIERRSSLDAVEALRAEPGVEVQQQTGLGDTVALRIRGSFENQVLVLQDGVPINDWSFGGGGLLSAFDPQSMGRMEVVRGPFSPLSASAAMGGVVRLETVRGDGQDRLLGRLDAGAPFGSKFQDGGFGGRIGGLATLGGSREYSGLAAYGAFTQAGSSGILTDPGRLALPVDRFDRGSGAVSWEAPVAGGKLLAVGRIEAFKTRLGVGSLEQTGNYYDSNRNYDQQLLLGSLRWTADQTERYAWSLRAGFARIADTDDNRFALGEGLATPIGQIQSVGRIDRVSAIGVVGTDHAYLMGGFGTLLFGAEFQAIAPSAHGALDAELPSGDALAHAQVNANETRLVFGTYAADKIRLGAFDALLGVRVDEVQRFGASVDPRGTLGYTLAATGTRFTVSAGTGYRAPSFSETKGSPFANPALKPEHAASGEAAVIQTFGRVGRASVAAFTTAYRDLVTFDPVAGQLRNLDKATFNGAEVATDLNFGLLRAGGALSYVRAVDQDGHRLPEVSEVLGNAHVGATAGALDADLFWYAWTDRRATEAIIDLAGASTDLLKGGNRIDLSASYWFTQQAPTTRLLLRVQDLLDRRLPEAVGFPPPGRTVLMGFEIATR